MKSLLLGELSQEYQKFQETKTHFVICEKIFFWSCFLECRETSRLMGQQPNKPTNKVSLPIQVAILEISNLAALDYYLLSAVARLTRRNTSSPVAFLGLIRLTTPELKCL